MMHSKGMSKTVLEVENNKGKNGREVRPIAFNRDTCTLSLSRVLLSVSTRSFIHCDVT